MSAKEQALKLCQEFGMTTLFENDNDGVSLSLKVAKKCAAISVNNIIKELESTEFNYGIEDTFKGVCLSKFVCLKQSFLITNVF